MNNTQHKNNSHRAKSRLDRASSRYRWMFEACNIARKQHEQNHPHIFINTDDVEPIAVEILENRGLLDKLTSLSIEEQINIFSCGLMWSSWRMTQGIYRFDDEIYDAVINTENSQKIPSEMLRQLPEWCVYVETPGLICDIGAGDTELFGVWVMFAMNYGQEVMLIFTDIEDENYDEFLPPCIHLDISEPTISDSVKLVLYISADDVEGDVEDGVMERLNTWLTPVINLLLYLCADREITHKGEILEPENPVPKKTKKGWRLFPSNGLKIWDVGVRLGNAIREAKAQPSYQSSTDKESTGRTVRPHVRRAHWRTILSGKMKDKYGNLIPSNERKQDLRWMPPIAVKLDALDKLPAVIRPVKK